MQQPSPSVIFDQAHAETYDERFAKLSPLRDTLYLLTGAVLAGLPPDARVLCVGAGTGSELVFLAEKFPRWRFTAVEPSGPMLNVCRRRIAGLGLTDRCDFHGGYLDSLPETGPFDAATSLLVSHFILDPRSRASYFEGIARRLQPGARLISADLAIDTTSPSSQCLFDVWFRLMKGADVSSKDIENLRQAYSRDVALWAPEKVCELIGASGFQTPVRFFQSGLMHAWFAARAL